MTEYLEVRHVTAIATAVLTEFGMEAKVRDFGLLASAVDRPKAEMFGLEAYPDLFTKAAALLHSLARNHAFVDGNKRTAWHACVVFLAVNGYAQLEPVDEDAAEVLVLDTAQGLIEVPDIAFGLRQFFE